MNTKSEHRGPKCILGLDPGLAITGYGVLGIDSRKPVLREGGVIRCPRQAPIERRLKELYEGIAEVFRSHDIVAVAIEQLYSHYERERTAILMGHARGVLCLAAANACVPVHNYLPTKVKKLLTGNGRAPKSQMQSAVQQQLLLTKLPEPPDVADALAVALCHFYNHSPGALRVG
jgi:crossover junction endodeoxyribonuclease RuvC